MRSTVYLLTLLATCATAHAQDGLTGRPILPSERRRALETRTNSNSNTPKTTRRNTPSSTPANAPKSGRHLSLLGHLKNSRGENSSSGDEVRIGRASPQEIAFSNAVKELEKRLKEGKELILREKSKHVLALQMLLEKLGMINKKNAKYDWRTRAALRGYQRKNGLPITGRLDSKTLDSLKKKSGFKPLPEPKPEPQPEAIDPSKSRPIPSSTPSDPIRPEASQPIPEPTSPSPAPVASNPAPAPVASTPAPAPKPPAPKPSYKTPTQGGKSLAAAAARVARRRNTVGRCYAGVAEAVDSAIGRFLWGMSAYMAADQLAKHPKFKEIKVAAKDLKTLPPGAIVVWRKTGRSPHGHISVALGDGREASDHIGNQMTSLRGDTGVRVFIVK